MIISFFEEFPTKENLSKLKLVSWNTKLFIAAKNLKEFERIKAKIRKKNITEFVYWPILEKEEGYWFSPFTKREALLRIFIELKNKNIPIMLDLEYPLTKNFTLIFTQCLEFIKNKKLINNFINNYKGKLYLAEYHVIGKTKTKFLQSLGLHYKNNNDNERVKTIKMLYHSMIPYSNNSFRKHLRKGKKVFGNDFIAGFGTIAKGILGLEPILSAGQLGKDLQMAKEEEVKETVIFRLGGLNKEYVKVLKKHLKNN